MRTIFSLLFLLFCLPAFAASPQYTITDIAPISFSYGQNGAAALNDKGQVVGEDRGHAFLWSSGQSIDLGTFPRLSFEDGTGSVAYGINNRGQIVGSSGGGGAIFGTGLRVARSFLIQNGKMMALGDHNASFEAYSINDSGQIVGLDGFRGFLYENGKLIDFGTLSKEPTGNRSLARSINNAKQVVGWTTIYHGRTHGRGKAAKDWAIHAFLWQRGKRPGRMQDLGSLAAYPNSYAYGINDKGQIIGSVSQAPYSNAGVFSADDSSQAFIWRKGKMAGLGFLPGNKTSRAFGINNQGEIVGQATCRGKTDTLQFHAVLWLHGKILDLNSLIPANSGWVLEEARAINNKGQIVGNGSLNGVRHAFLLTPTANDK